MSSAPRIDVCTWLRARGAYGRDVDETSWMSGDSPVDGYWCLRTMEAAGPDDRLVHAHGCRPSRACFEATPAERIPADDAGLPEDADR